MKIPIAILTAPAALFRYLTCISCRIWEATFVGAAKYTAISLGAAGLIGSSLSLPAATPPGTSLISTIELSPGGSAYSPGQFGFNQATHKLYTLAPYLVNQQPCAAAVINTATGSFVTGIRDPKNTVTSDGGLLVPYGMAVDDSTTAGGNKVYYVSEVGYSSTQRLVLVTGDGATSSIDPNTAVILPLPISQPASFGGGTGIGVNPVNHKVYVSDYYGTVAVVDGPNHSVIRTIQMPSGNGANLIVAIPASNKMLAFPFGPVVLIDSSTDSFTTLSIPIFYASDAAYDSANGRIYAVGQDQNGTTQLMVFDGGGAIVASTTADVPSGASAIAVDAVGGKIYVGTPTPYDTNGTIIAFSATSLAVVGSFPQGAGKLAIDSTNNSRLYLLDYHLSGANIGLLNQVGVLNVNNGLLAKLTVGYRPGSVAVNRQTNRTYVTDAQAPELVVIDGASDSVSARVAVKAVTSGAAYPYQTNPRLIAVSEDVNRIYLPRLVINPVDGTQGFFVDVLDGSTNALITTISVGSSYINALAVDDTRRHLLVATQGTMYVYGLDSNSLVATAAVPGSVIGMVANPATGRIYLGIRDGGGYVTVLDGDSYNVVAASVESGAGPAPTAVDQKRNKIYVANTAAGSVANSFTVIDGATNISQTIDNISSNTGGDAVGAVAVDEVSNTVYVLDNANGSGFPGWVTVYGAANNYAFLGEIAVGTAPTGMAFNSTSRQLFVTNENDGTVSVLLNGTRPPPPLPAHGGLSDTYFSVDGYASGGTVVNGTPLAFLAQQSGTPAGLNVRVQASIAPNDLLSWTSLPNGTDGFMAYDASSQQFVLTSANYPLSGGVYFRAISAAPGYPDSISPVVGPFNLTTNLAPPGQTILRLVANGIRADLDFRVTEAGAPSGPALRVQTSTTPGSEASWIDLTNGNSGQMTQTTDPAQFVLLINNYPAGTAVYFRAVAAAAGSVDSISNVIGPYDFLSDIPPTVTFASPPGAGGASGQDVNHPIVVFLDPNGSVSLPITVDASGNRQVHTLSVLFDGRVIKQVSDLTHLSVNYVTSVPGLHIIEAVAVDDLGATGRAGTGPIYVLVAPANGVSNKASSATANTRIQQASTGGDTYTLIGDGKNWSDPTAWSGSNGGNGVPGPSDVAIVSSLTVLIDVTVNMADKVEVGSLIISGGHIKDVNGSLKVDHLLTISGGGIEGGLTLEIPSTATVNMINDVDFPFDGDIYNYGNWQMHGSGGIAGLTYFLNQGTTNFQMPLLTAGLSLGLAPTDRTISTATLANTGSILASGIPGLISHDGGSLISHDGGSLISHDGGSIISEHGGGVISNDGGSLISHDGGSLISHDGGSLISHDGGSLVSSGGGNFQVGGGAAVASSGKLKAATAGSGFTQTAGETDLNLIRITGPVTINGGALSGSGVIAGDLTLNGGYVLPGHGAGLVAVTGNYTQGAQGTLILENGGPSPGQFDQLQVGGVANLGGKLDIKTINGYTPDPADTFSPLGFGSVSGTFESVSSNAQVTVAPTGLLTSIDPTKPNPTNGQPLNIATRLQIQSGDNVLIAGFIITGPAGSSKKVLIRGIGPSLADFGVAGTIPDPLLELHNPDGSVVTNDNWQEAPNAADIPAGFAPGNNLESAIYTTLSPGAYTAIVKGAHDEAGIGLAEVYDFDTASTAKLSNIATRGFVNTGDNAMIGGFIIGGTEPARILVRAIGPSLTQFGLQGALLATTLELHDSNGSVISNEGWRSTQESEIQATTIPPSDDNEAAILATLAPGNYTAVVRGKNDTTGIAVVEAYNLQ
jgi:DNA-binding beta-propeller fold protein YncE